MKTRTIDTSVLVRLLVNDDSVQYAKAVELATKFRLFILPTVLLETEWVLRSRFKFRPGHILSLFRGMMASESFIFSERGRIARSLNCFEGGMDFADALHVCFTADGETFVTFDQNLVKLANKHIDTVGVELAS